MAQIFTAAWRRLLETFDWAHRADFAAALLDHVLDWRPYVTGLLVGAIIWIWGFLTTWGALSVVLGLAAAASIAIIYIAIATSRATPKVASAPHPTASERDWPIRELFGYIRPDLPLRSIRQTGNTTIDDFDERWRPVGDQVISQLSLGRLQAIGRGEMRRPIRHLAHAPIPSEFWQSAEWTYYFLDPDGQEMDHVRNSDGTIYSDVQVNRAEALEIWSNREIPLFEAASRAYEQTRNRPISVAAEGLTDGPDDILTWYCYIMARPQNGREPLIRLWGVRPPSRQKEEIYVDLLDRYDFVVENGQPSAQFASGIGRVARVVAEGKTAAVEIGLGVARRVERL